MTPKILLVGGAVRDKLLGLPAKDEDFVVVGADAQYMLDQGFKQVGAAFPVFLHPETGDEYALARREKKVAPGYQGFEFEFGPHVTIEDDLLRRDLTMNSIAYDFKSGEFIDPYGGIKDINDRVIRHTSKAFAEDPLRVLRVARFMARYGFRVAEDTFGLCEDLVNAGELEALSADRIWTEMNKLLSEKNPSIGLNFLQKVGALDKVKRINGLISPDVLFEGDIEEIEEKLTLAEKQFIFLDINTLVSKEEVVKFRIPADVVRACKFLHAINELYVDASFDNTIALVKVVKFVDSFREEVKHGQISKASDLMKKQHVGLRPETIKFLKQLNAACDELLKLDFTESVRELKPAEIKRFVMNKKVETVKRAIDDN